MNAITTRTTDDDISFRCSPLRGDWKGGEEILMVIPKIDKRRGMFIMLPMLSQHWSLTS
jgi:hypothetical protein